MSLDIQLHQKLQDRLDFSRVPWGDLSYEDRGVQAWAQGRGGILIVAALGKQSRPLLTSRRSRICESPRTLEAPLESIWALRLATKLVPE